jgi:hypothetical protein
MHIKKYTMATAGHMLQHYSRDMKKAGEHIDPNRTGYNYNLGAKDNPGTQLARIKQRLQEAPPARLKKDLIVMCDWVITVPQSLPEEKYTQFFEEAYSFLSQRYGCKNVVSAYVHLDEQGRSKKTGRFLPHLHFCFVPVIYDKKLQREKVNGKGCISRVDLQKIHPEIQAYLETQLGCQVEILNGETAEGNKSIAELKRLSATSELNEVEQSVSDIEKVDNRKKESRGLPGKEQVVKLTKSDYEKILEKTKSGAEKSYIIKKQKAEIGELSWRLEQEHRNARQLSKTVIELKTRLRETTVKYHFLCDVLKTVFEECPNFQTAFNRVKASLKARKKERAPAQGQESQQER